MADTKISAETSASTLDGTEIVPVVQGGNNRKTTTRDIANLSGQQLISTLTASSSAALEWTGLTGDDYLMIIRGLTPATNGADINLQMGTGGTPTWITASTYKYSAEYWVESTNTGGSQSGTTSPGIQLGNAVDNSAGGLVGCRVELFALSLAVRHLVVFDGYRMNGGAAARIGGRGSAAGSTAKTALRLIASSGNLASGSASLYRIVP